MRMAFYKDVCYKLYDNPEKQRLSYKCVNTCIHIFFYNFNLPFIIFMKLIISDTKEKHAVLAFFFFLNNGKPPFHQCS